MPAIQILIPDTAFRDAVAEQLKQAAFAVAEATMAVFDHPPLELTTYLLDEAACDAKLVKKLRSFKNDKCLLFVLGAVPPACDELIAENFAKPLRLGHLLARLHFYQEVAPRRNGAPVMIGAYQLQTQLRNLIRGEETVRLTEKETALLEYLAQSAAPVAREELLAAVWGYDARIDTHTLETHIYQLRRKTSSDLIVNENGLYRLAK